MRYAVMLVLALVLAGAVLLVVARIDKKREKKNAELYLRILETGYKQDGVLAALQSAQKSFKEKSCEWRALDEAVFYLQKSILRDYKTAFSIVEKGFPGKEVKIAHDMVLAEQKRTQFLPGRPS